MRNRAKAWGLGLVLCTALLACTPEVRELGDDPAEGSGGKGGSGSILPKGGQKATGGSVGTPAAAGSAGAPSACFSPTQPELALNAAAVGCPCDGEEDTCVSVDTDADAKVPSVWYGMLRCESGRWKSVPPTCDRPLCFAPNNYPELAFEQPDAGCACQGESDECVGIERSGHLSRVALHCEAGKWQSVAEGACGKAGETDCRVGGAAYPHGAQRIPDPFSCNECSCNHGNLACTERACPQACPEGSFPAKRCLQCGPADQCLEVETGCLTGDGCETGWCTDYICG